MAGRHLNIGAFLSGIAVHGNCSKCGAVFRVLDSTALLNVEEARERLVADFDAHDCAATMKTRYSFTIDTQDDPK